MQFAPKFADFRSKIDFFLGKGHSPLPRSLPSGEGTSLPTLHSPRRLVPHLLILEPPLFGSHISFRKRSLIVRAFLILLSWHNLSRLSVYASEVLNYLVILWPVLHSNSWIFITFLQGVSIALLYASPVLATMGTSVRLSVCPTHASTE